MRVCAVEYCRYVQVWSVHVLEFYCACARVCACVLVRACVCLRPWKCENDTHLRLVQKGQPLTNINNQLAGVVSVQTRAPVALDQRVEIAACGVFKYQTRGLEAHSDELYITTYR